MQNGYQQISNYLARGLDIRLGATVTEIAHDEDGITVTTADGSNFTCEIPPAFPPTSVLSPVATVMWHRAVSKTCTGLYNECALRFVTVVQC